MELAEFYQIKIRENLCFPAKHLEGREILIREGQQVHRATISHLVLWLTSPCPRVLRSSVMFHLKDGFLFDGIILIDRFNYIPGFHKHFVLVPASEDVK